MVTDERRLIEDYLPIEAISKEASREKSVRKGHISTLHLWWARRPLVACRAAVYGTLVPASQFVPENGPDNKKQSLGRANAARFVTELCKYPGNPTTIKKAQEHILDAHAQRLSQEMFNAIEVGEPLPEWVEEFKWPKDQMDVTHEDIEAGRAPRPRVLDMFAGGGAIPLEALRLGCEAYALDLNPVAHIIELCTLVYPQKYGNPDPTARGTTGSKNEKGETTWGGLAEEVRYWGNWVLDKVKAEIGDLYPLIPDPEAKEEEIVPDSQQVMGFAEDPQGKLKVKKGNLIPIAYLWTRTVRCKNPACGASVPLVKQTWLCKKKGRYVALRMVALKGDKQVRFEVVRHTKESDFDFDPSDFSSAGNATCPFCGTVVNIDYVKEEGWNGRMSLQIMAATCVRTSRSGRIYVEAKDFWRFIPDDECMQQRIDAICERTGLTVPDEAIGGLPTDSRENSLGITVRPYGLRSWGDLFTGRQKLTLLTFASAIRSAQSEMCRLQFDSEIIISISSYLAMYLDRGSDHWSMLCAWNPSGEKIQHTFGRQVVTMVWDFSEANPFGGSVGDWAAFVQNAENGIWAGTSSGNIPGSVVRGSATSLPWSDGMMDAVITDPPYYDNIPYADISDFFYVWLKRSVGHLYPEHFAGAGTPKKNEAVADTKRYRGSRDCANAAYEKMMSDSFLQAHRVLKPEGELAVVYAHKTTLGWATLVDALRNTGFTVTEAWPLNTELKTRLRGMESAALASSIFLVARKRREGAGTGSYEKDVKTELGKIVRERVSTLWAQGITGADLVIACVGAGLRAFTRFSRVEYANGEEVPAERFLAEVEAVVLETILDRLSKEIGGNGNCQTSLAGVDPATRFYILWRYTYRWTELDAGEAIIFANGTHVELDGQGSLSQGSRALIEKKKSKYWLLDFKDRGEDEKIGLPDPSTGSGAPLIDALHRTLWLMENRPIKLAEFLRESGVNREQMRLVAQALAGPALKGGELSDVSPTGELAALGKLTANWRSVVEDAALTPTERVDRKKGQMQIEYSED